MSKILSNLEIFVGTYDSYLLSFKIKQLNKEFVLQRVIAQNTHTSSIRCVHAGGRFLASGGADDRIVIIDLKKNQEIQMLTHHTGTVNQICFSPDGSYLFSASDDGSLAATKTGSWITDNTWKSPHSNKAITQISIHPSGKLALTLGRDFTLRTWNMVKGRQVFTTNLKNLTASGHQIDQVHFSPNGELFSLVAIDKVLIMNVGSAAIVKEIATEVRTMSLCWIDENTILLGQMNGKIKFVQIDGEKTKTVDAHANRVKDMSLLNGHLVTISNNNSTGDIAVWKVSVDRMELTKICASGVGRRPICLALIDAALYQSKIVQKNEDQLPEEVGVDGDVEEGNKRSGKPIVTAAKVTIENDQPVDSGNEEMRTPAPKLLKKRKSRDFNSEPYTPSASVRTLPPSTEKISKKKKNRLNDIDQTPVAAVVPDSRDDEVSTSKKKSKKQKNLLLENAIDDDAGIEIVHKKLNSNRKQLPAADETVSSKKKNKKIRNDESFNEQSMPLKKRKLVVDDE